MQREAGDEGLRRPIGLHAGEPAGEQGEHQLGRVSIDERIPLGGRQAKLVAEAD